MTAGPKHVLSPAVCGLVTASAKPGLPTATWSLRAVAMVILTAWVLARSEFWN